MDSLVLKESYKRPFIKKSSLISFLREQDYTHLHALKCQSPESRLNSKHNSCVVHPV